MTVLGNLNSGWTLEIATETVSFISVQVKTKAASQSTGVVCGSIYVPQIKMINEEH